MAYGNTTDNYGLPQWEADDKPTREDFNDAFEAIDEQTVSLAGAQSITGVKVFTGGFDAVGDCNFESANVTFKHEAVEIRGLCVNHAGEPTARVRNIRYGTGAPPSDLADGEIYFCY